MVLGHDEQCPQCGRYDNRGVTVDALILKGKQILLIRRGAEPFKGYWALPGGYVGWDETIQDAIKREVLEEVGLEVTALKQLPVYSDPGRHPRQCIDIPFLVSVEGEIKAGDDAKDAKYFDLNSLPELAFDHQLIIEDYTRYT